MEKFNIYFRVQTGTELPISEQSTLISTTVSTKTEFLNSLPHTYYIREQFNLLNQLHFVAPLTLAGEISKCALATSMFWLQVLKNKVKDAHLYFILFFRLLIS